MINVYNESDLHKTLKFYYAQMFNGKTEQKFDRFICDIISETHGIIEIQTSNLQALKEKCKTAIKSKINFTIVHPIIIEKKIENYTEEKILISKRKSPKKENIYTAIKSLTGLVEILPNKFITIIFVEVSITEKRIQTKEKILLKNKSRRRPKTWYKEGKSLTEIFGEYKFKTKSDYLKLLPKLEKSQTEFSSKEIKTAFLQNSINLKSNKFIKDEKIQKSAILNTNLLLWILHKMNLIEKIENSKTIESDKKNNCDSKKSTNAKNKKTSNTSKRGRFIYYRV